MTASIYTLTIGNETPREFNSRPEALQVVKDRVEETGEAFDFEIRGTHFCTDCGEVREYSFIQWCADCRFRNSDAVKAARKIIRAFKKAGNPIVKVWDGGEDITGNERDLLEAVHSADTSYLYTESGAHILIVAVNESEADCVCDYSTSIEDIMQSVNLKEF